MTRRGRRDLEIVVAAYVAAFLVLSASAGAGFIGRQSWGLCLNKYLPIWVQVLLFCAAVATLVPAAGRALIRITQLMARAIESRPRVGVPLLTLACFGLLLAFQSRKAYYGLELAVNDLNRAYATNLLSNVFLQAVKLLFSGLAFMPSLQDMSNPAVDPSDPIVALASLIAGAIFAPVLWALSRELAPSEGRGPAFIMVLLAPSLALFAGHREIYFVPALGLALFCLAMLSDLRNDRLPWRSSLAAFAALGSHALNVSVLPALAVVGWATARDRSIGRRAAALAIPFLAGAALLFSWLLIFKWGCRIPEGNFDRFGSFAHLLPGESGLFWIRALDPQAPGGFFSGAHLIDLCNLILFMAPQIGLILAALAASACKRKHGGDRRLLALVALWIGPLVVAAIDRPFGGHLAQWAHSGGFALCSALLMTYLWFNVLDGGEMDAGSAALIGLSFFHTLGFMLLNALNLGPYLGKI